MATTLPSAACAFNRAIALKTSTRTLAPRFQQQHAKFATQSRCGVSCLSSRANTVQTQTQRSSPVTSALYQSRQSSTSSSPDTTTTTTTTSAASTPTPTPTTTTASGSLTYNQFFALRRQRRYLNLGTSVLTSLASIATATPVLASYEIDRLGAQLTGMDPMFVIGGSLMAVGTLGWLAGPFLGTAVFNGVWKRGVAGEFGEKEKSFYGHIKRYRADPAMSSYNNPVPDYYGEKIASVSDYRRWLKDQRAFNRKKNKNMI